METVNFGTRPHITRSQSKNSCLRARSSIWGHCDHGDSDKRATVAMGHVLRNVCRALPVASFYFVSERNWENKPMWRNQFSFSTLSLAKDILWAYIYLFMYLFNPLNPELNPISYLLALLGAHHFLHVSRIRVKLLTLRLLMSYIYGAPILDVSRSHTTTQHSR